MDPNIIAGAIIVILAVAGVLIWNYVPRRGRLRRLEARLDLSMEEIYNEFFAAKHFPKELVCELWAEVAGSLRVPPGKLRPADRFDLELAPVKGWEYDDEIMDLQWAAERRLARTGIRADLSHVENISAYVELFCRIAEEKREG